MDEYARMPEFPVFAREATKPADASTDDSSTDGSSAVDGAAVDGAAVDGAAAAAGGSVGGVAEALATLTESARALFAAVMQAQADRRVAMADLAPIVHGANLLERAASAVTIAATAGYARREEHDDLDDIATPVESIRARGFVAEWAATELGHLLRLSSRTAGGRVASAAQLTARFPRVLEAVAAGAVEAWQADKAIGLLMEAGADDETARAVDAWLGPRLATADPSRILTLTRYALGRVAPHLLPERAKRNRARRAIEKWEVEPGLCEITARMPTHQAAAIWSAATTLAKDYQRLQPELSLDQARLDAFVDLALANVTVTTHVTLGIPVVTSAYARTGDTPTAVLDEPAVDDRDDPSYHCDIEHDPDTDPPDDPWHDDPWHDDDPDRPDPEHGRTTAGASTTPGGRKVEEVHPVATSRDDASPPSNERSEEGAGPAGPPGPLGIPDSGYRGPGTAPLRVPTWAAHPQGSPPSCAGQQDRAWWLCGVHLPGIGYVPPDIVQSLVERLDATISVALLDAERGILLSHTTNAYRPTTAISQLVRTRDGQCRFFGCTQPAAGCDLDHAVAYAHAHAHARARGRGGSGAEGGATCAQNLAPLCRRHHRAKQRREWTYLLDPDTGAAWWTNTRTGSMRTTLPSVPAGALDPPLVPAGPPPPADHEDDRLPSADLPPF